jgi:hypothetical protein
LTIPDSVTNIGNLAFYNCSSSNYWQQRYKYWTVCFYLLQKHNFSNNSEYYHKYWKFCFRTVYLLRFYCMLQKNSSINFT